MIFRTAASIAAASLVSRASHLRAAHAAAASSLPPLPPPGARVRLALLQIAVGNDKGGLDAVEFATQQQKEPLQEEQLHLVLCMVLV